MATNPQPGELLGLASGRDDRGRVRLVAQVWTDEGPILGTLHTNPTGDRGAITFTADDSLTLIEGPE